MGLLDVAGWADLVKAYKKLAKERKAMVNVVKQTSPFEDLSDTDALLAHYSNLNNSIKVCEELLLSVGR